MKDIDSFKKEYSFLSNFYIYSFYYRGWYWKSVEHCFQAHKTLDDAEFDLTQYSDTPAKAKRLGRECTLREDWGSVKDTVMYMSVLCKFSQNVILKRKLLETGTKYLKEGNYWHDNYWGDCFCERCNDINGKNRLGGILMDVRMVLGYYR